jgi:hypothetical protein
LGGKGYDVECLPVPWVGGKVEPLVRLSYIKKMRGTKQQNSAVQPTTAIVAGKGGQERKPDELSFGP